MPESWVSCSATGVPVSSGRAEMAAESAMVEVVSASTLSFLASITSMVLLQVSTFSKCGRPTNSERRAAMIRSTMRPNFNGGRSQIRSERLG